MAYERRPERRCESSSCCCSALNLQMAECMVLGKRQHYWHYAVMSDNLSIQLTYYIEERDAPGITWILLIT